MATLEECSIGVIKKSDCHRKEYGQNLDCDKQEPLLWRSGLIVENVNLNILSVCSYHCEYNSECNQVTIIDLPQNIDVHCWLFLLPATLGGLAPAHLGPAFCKHFYWSCKLPNFLYTVSRSKLRLLYTITSCVINAVIPRNCNTLAIAPWQG